MRESLISFSYTQLFESCVIFLLGLGLIITLSRTVDVEKKAAVFLYLWHSVICVGHLIYTLYIPADSETFYHLSLNNTHFGYGTSFISFFLSFFTQYLNSSYITLFVLFNVIGSIGLVVFYAVLRAIVKEEHIYIQKMALLVILIPSISFWSSAIGKDAICFLAIALSLWGSLLFYKRLHFMLFAVVLMFLVRPHLSAIMIAAVVVAFLFEEGIQKRYKFIFVSAAGAVVYYVMPIILSVTRLGKIERFFDYILSRQQVNLNGTTSFDLASMSLPTQLFNFAFRPLPYEAYNIAILAISLENFYLLLVVLLAVYSAVKVKFRVVTQVNLYFVVTYLVGSWLLLSSVIANYGLLARQKWMVLPFLILICFVYISKRGQSMGQGNGE